MPDRNVPRRTTEPAYTLAAALHDAAELLRSEFGDADQEAAVLLADRLFSGHLQAEFELRGKAAASETPYGAHSP